MPILHKNKLLQYRLRHNFTQEHVMRELGLESTSRISHWEHGKSMPSMTNVFKLSNLYRTTSEKLYPVLNKRVRKQKRVMEGIVPLIPRSHDEMSTDEWVEQYAAIIFEAYLYTKEKQLPISGKSES